MLRLLAPLAVSLAVAGLGAVPAAAVPCGPMTCAPLSSAVPGSRALLVRPQGQHGPLIAYDLASGRAGKYLPAGVLSADGRTFVVASNQIQATRLTSYAAATGARRASMPVAGWNLKIAAVSADGRYAALVDGQDSPTVIIADLRQGRLAWSTRLQGRWAVDALSRDGRRLYLIQYQQSGDYHVRLYDAATGLAAEAITDPSEPGAMTGLPWSSIGSRDGHWQLTLYLEAQGTRTGAFVHALSLTGAEARCIDLPGGDFLAAGRYALTLAPDGHTLYAANPSLGVIAVIDLARHAVHKIVHFPAAAADTSTSTAFGAISPNGKTLYFSAGSGVLAFDTHSTASRGPYKLGDVRGLGFSPSGRSLLVVKADGSTVQLNPKNGTPIKR